MTLLIQMAIWLAMVATQLLYVLSLAAKDILRVVMCTTIATITLNKTISCLDDSLCLCCSLYSQHSHAKYNSKTHSHTKFGADSYDDDHSIDYNSHIGDDISYTEKVVPYSL